MPYKEATFQDFSELFFLVKTVFGQEWFENDTTGITYNKDDDTYTIFYYDGTNLDSHALCAI
jgi:hypothetical protein